MSWFSINFDYRCPFARNANEHVLTAVEAGAPWHVEFRAFSLTAVHAEEGDPPVFSDPAKRPELVALAAGVVVRDRFPEQFYAAHRSLFAARHDDGGDLRDDAVVRNALQRAGVDPDAVYEELASGWPFATIEKEHVEEVAAHQVFGVPTFGIGENSVFVRIMTRPRDDAVKARATIEHVLSLIADHPELNEVKHTTVPR